MEYKISSVETDFGKGTRIEAEGKTLEQIKCRNGLYARIYGTSSDSNGVIFGEKFRVSDEDYERFTSLAKGLEELSGEKIPHTVEDFMEYNSGEGLNRRLKNGLALRIKTEDEKQPKHLDDFHNIRVHGPGAWTTLLAWGGGITLGALTGGWGLALGYGIAFPFIEGFTGGIYTKINKNEEWCGPAHALGYIPSNIIFNRQMANPEYLLNKFIESYKELKGLSVKVSSLKAYHAQKKSVEKYFNLVEEMFTHTTDNKGFYVSCDNSSRERIAEDFRKILSFWNTAKAESKEQKENPVSQKPAPESDNNTKLAEVGKGAAEIARGILR